MKAYKNISNIIYNSDRSRYKILRYSVFRIQFDDNVFDIIHKHINAPIRINVYSVYIQIYDIL